MPLPYAPPPKDSKVYRDLKNIKVSGVTSDQMDTLKNELYAQGTDGSEDEMRRLLLLGLVANQSSSSGPIANTQQVTNTNLTTSGNVDLFTPEEGEVWQLVAAGSSAGYTGLSWLILKIFDTSNSLSVEIASQTSFNTEFALNEPIFVGYPCKLLLSAGGTGTGGSCDVSMSLVRVR